MLMTMFQAWLNMTNDEIPNGTWLYQMAAFAVYRSFGSHTGATMALGKSSVTTFSTKYKQFGGSQVGEI